MTSKIKIKTSEGDITCELFDEQAPNTVANFITLIEDGFYNNLAFHRVISNFMAQGGCPEGTGMGNPGYVIEDEINADSLGLNEEAAFDKGIPKQQLMIRSEEDFQKTILAPLFHKMNIKSQEELNERAKEVEESLANLTLKSVYELQGFKYRNDIKSSKVTKHCLAMANSGPNTNGSQFFVNFIDTPWLDGKHTVFGKVVEGFEALDKIENLASEDGKTEDKINFSIEIISKKLDEYKLKKLG